MRSSEGDERCAGVMYACDIITVSAQTIEPQFKRMTAAYWLAGHSQVPYIRVDELQRQRIRPALMRDKETQAMRSI